MWSAKKLGKPHFPDTPGLLPLQAMPGTRGTPLALPMDAANFEMPDAVYSDRPRGSIRTPGVHLRP